MSVQILLKKEKGGDIGGNLDMKQVIVFLELNIWNI